MERRIGDQATDELNIDDLVKLTDTGSSDYAKAPEGLRIGHVHLRVGDIGEADSFYHGTIGLDPTRRRNGASFLSSGRYHHHLALNVWQSAGAGRRDETATGLAWFSLEIEKPNLLAARSNACVKPEHRSPYWLTASKQLTRGARACG
jgi:catechol 2,3-dioxygenase